MNHVPYMHLSISRKHLEITGRIAEVLVTVCKCTERVRQIERSSENAVKFSEVITVINKLATGQQRCFLQLLYVQFLCFQQLQPTII